MQYRQALAGQIDGLRGRVGFQCDASETKVRAPQFSLDGRVVMFIIEKLLVELPGGVEQLMADGLEPGYIQKPILAHLCEIALNPVKGEMEIGLSRLAVALGQCR